MRLRGQNRVPRPPASNTAHAARDFFTIRTPLLASAHQSCPVAFSHAALGKIIFEIHAIAGNEGSQQ
jgi:hypothetical protein